MEEKLKRLIQLQELIEVLQEEEASIKMDVMLDVDYKDAVVDGYKITKVSTNKTVIKKGIDKEILMEKFPEAVVTAKQLDMKLLDANPAAHDYLEIQEGGYVRITKQKE